MKEIGTLLISAAALVMFLVLVVAGARAQSLSTTSFTGTFTLPVDAEWGAMTLPAGNYTLSYGTLLRGGFDAVTVDSKEEEGPRGWILAGPQNTTKATENTLICIRQGNKAYVRGLELPAIGKSVSFALPHGAMLVAEQRKSITNVQLAEVRLPIERVPATR